MSVAYLESLNREQRRAVEQGLRQHTPPARTDHGVKRRGAARICAVPVAHEEANKWVSPLGSFRIHPHLQRPVDLFERRPLLN